MINFKIMLLIDINFIKIDNIFEKINILKKEIDNSKCKKKEIICEKCKSINFITYFYQSSRSNISFIQIIECIDCKFKKSVEHFQT